MGKNEWINSAALDRIDGIDGLVWASKPLPAPSGAEIQPFVLRDGDGYQPCLRHANGDIEMLNSEAEFGAAYGAAKQGAAAWINAQGQQSSVDQSMSGDFAALDGAVWRGEPVVTQAQLEAVPFVLHDGAQFQPRLLHPDGGLAVFAAQPNLAEACRTALLAADQWLLQQSAFARRQSAPELFEAKPVYTGPTFIVDDAPVDSSIRPVVTQDMHGRFHAQLHSSEPGIPDGDMYLVAGPFSGLDMAKDAALVAAFAVRLPAADELSLAVRSWLMRDMALGYLSETGEWALSLGDGEDDFNDAKAALLDAADLNRLLILDPEIEGMLLMADASLMDRLVAVGIRASDLSAGSGAALDAAQPRQATPRLG